MGDLAQVIAGARRLQSLLGKRQNREERGPCGMKAWASKDGAPSPRTGPQIQEPGAGVRSKRGWTCYAASSTVSALLGSSVAS